LRDKEVSLSKEDRQLLRRAARGDAPAEEMLAAKKLLDRQSQDPLKRDVLQRARGGRPMYTRPLNIGSEGEIMEMSLDKSRPYRNVPDSLMGYRRHGQQRGFEDSNYPHTQNVEITLDNGDKFTDAIKGMNRRHAIERAYRNWVGAKNIRAIPEPSRIPIRGKFDEPGYGGPS
jgi:hypothetical protein